MSYVDITLLEVTAIAVLSDSLKCGLCALSKLIHDFMCSLERIQHRFVIFLPTEEGITIKTELILLPLSNKQNV